MTTLLSSDRDHAIDRLAASAPELVVRCITDFAEDTISLATAFEMVVRADEVLWTADRLTLAIDGVCAQFPEVTEHG
jgi:hypothetical protein